MKPSRYTIGARQGSTLRRRFEWTIDSDPVDLTGRTARMNIRPSASSATLILDASEYITLGGSEGTINLEVPASVMTMPAKTYVYDLEIVHPNNGEEEVIALLEGSFVVDAEVTRPQPEEPEESEE